MAGSAALFWSIRVANPFLMKGGPSMSIHFIHSGYLNPERPGNLKVELDSMTDIKVMIGYGPNEEAGTVKCGAPLVHGPIHFVEE